jgi:hypothetical protein
VLSESVIASFVLAGIVAAIDPGQVKDQVRSLKMPLQILSGIVSVECKNLAIGPRFEMGQQVPPDEAGGAGNQDGSHAHTAC